MCSFIGTKKGLIRGSMGDSVHQACARGVRWGGEGAEGAGGRGGGKVEGEGWTNLCATASGLPFGGSSPLEAQVEWLLLKLSSKTPKHLDIDRWTCQKIPMRTHCAADLEAVSHQADLAKLSLTETSRPCSSA